MSSYSKQVRDTIEKISHNKIFVANEIKSAHLSDVPETTYYKVLERMVRDKEIVHLTKGLYYRPTKGAEGTMSINEEQIVEHYVSGNKGIIVGKKLYAQKEIISEVIESTQILSNNLQEEKKHIGTVEVQKLNLNLDNHTIPVLETLEILQDYHKTEHIDKNRFLAYMKGFAEKYSDEAACYVIENRKYKKSTIAFLERLLAWYGIENSLRQYLSPLSEYKVPTIEELRPGIPAEMKHRLNEYVLQLQQIYHTYLDKVILYGSYARGDYTEDSDIDIMILLQMPDLEIKKYRHQLSGLTYDFNVNYDMDIKPIAKSKSEFAKWVDTYPFYANIKREGVELFGVA